MSYTITLTNQSPITIDTGEIDNSTSLTLIGKNVPNYGEAIAQNLVDMMQNFAGTDEPNGIVTGQLWYDTNNNILKIYNGSDYTRIATTVVGPTAPSTANPGDLWWDNFNSQLKIYSGAAWIVIGPYTGSESPIYADNIADTSNVVREVARINVNNSNAMVISTTAFTAKTSYAGITNIPNGLYVINNQTIGGSLTVLGTAYLTAQAAKYADLAENYNSDFEYEAGTVVMIGGTAEVTAANIPNTHKVVGVVSDKPAYLMNSELAGIKVAVALQGRVPCKVIGLIEKGDLLTSSDVSGVACRNNAASAGTIIGKALENYNSDSIGEIEIIVGKH